MADEQTELVPRKPQPDEGLGDGFAKFAGAIEAAPKNLVKAVSEEWQLVSRAHWWGHFFGACEGIVLAYVCMKAMLWWRGGKV